MLHVFRYLLIHFHLFLLCKISNYNTAVLIRFGRKLARIVIARPSFSRNYARYLYLLLILIVRVFRLTIMLKQNSLLYTSVGR